MLYLPIVRYLALAELNNEDVGRLERAVHNLVLVQVFQALNDALGEPRHEYLLHILLLSFLEPLLECLGGHILLEHVERFFLAYRSKVLDEA